MMGGKDFVVQHLKWTDSITSVICRWGHLSRWVIRAPTRSVSCREWELEVEPWGPRAGRRIRAHLA